jgi:hypothetical protein
LLLCTPDQAISKIRRQLKPDLERFFVGIYGGTCIIMSFSDELMAMQRVTYLADIISGIYAFGERAS